MSTSNGQPKADTSPSRASSYQPVNGFNASEVKDFLSRDVGAIAAYKPEEAGEAEVRNSGAPWGSKRKSSPISLVVLRSLTPL